MLLYSFKTVVVPLASVNASSVFALLLPSSGRFIVTTIVFRRRLRFIIVETCFGFALPVEMYLNSGKEMEKRE